MRAVRHRAAARLGDFLAAPQAGDFAVVAAGKARTRPQGHLVQDFPRGGGPVSRIHQDFAVAGASAAGVAAGAAAGVGAGAAGALTMAAGFAPIFAQYFTIAGWTSN